MNILDIGLIGLDFGSSKTVISIQRKGALEIILNDCSMRETHNLVGFTEKETLMGDHALLKLKSNFKNTVLYPIRYLNPEIVADSSFFQTEQKWQSASMKTESNQEIVFEVNYLGKTKKFSVTQILALLLGFYNQKVVKASKFVYSKYGFVISVPPYFTPEERFLLARSADICGMKLLKILNESTSVGLIYKKIHDDELAKLPTGKRVLFVDVGYSKTGVFLINFAGGSLNIVHEMYDRYLGVRDIDSLLMDFYKDIIKKDNPNFQENFKIRLRILEGIEKQRKMLSANVDAPIMAESIYEDYDLNHTMTRQEFEGLVTPFVEQMSALFLRFKVEAEIFGKSIEADEVEIIGGGVRIPLVQKIIMESFDQTALAKTLNATECIAMGSALQCSKAAGVLMNPIVVMTELIYHSIYCSTKPKGITEILVFSKGAPFPCGTSITIVIDETTKAVVFYYKLNDREQVLYEIDVENEKKGVISIKLAINDDGVLIFKDWKVNEKKSEMKFTKDFTQIISEKALNEFRIENEKIVQHDKIIQESYEMKNKMESFIYSKREEIQTKFKPFLKEDDLSFIQKTFQEYEQWLYNHDDSQSLKGDYESKMQEMETKIDPILSQCFDLHEIETLKKNEISSIKQLKSIANGHKKEPFADIINLNLFNQKIGDGGGIFGYFKDGMIRVKEKINSLKILDTLRMDLRNNHLSDSGLDHLTEILENQLSVQSLDLLLNNEEGLNEAKNNFSEQALFRFLEKLRDLDKLRRLKLCLDQIDEINFKFLIIGLENLKNLEKVEIKITKGKISKEAQNTFKGIKNINKSIKECRLECPISEEK